MTENLTVIPVDSFLNEVMESRKRLVDLLKTDQFIMRENDSNYLFMIFKDRLEAVGICDLPAPVSEEIFKVEKKDSGKPIKIWAKTPTAVANYFENLLKLNKEGGIKEV